MTGHAQRLRTATARSKLEPLLEVGAVGGRTVQINDRGEVECHVYPVAPLPDDRVRVRTTVSAISPGTEMTFFGRAATNVYLHKTWNERLRIFTQGVPTLEYPVLFGYRAAGTVCESAHSALPVGTRLFGNWRHTEYTTIRVSRAAKLRIPERLTDADAVDLGQMGPICVNAVAYAEGEHVGSPTVVFGAGPVGLITAQVAKITGAPVVYIVDRLPYRLQIAESLGLIPLDASAISDVPAHLKRRIGSAAVPVAFECSGSTVALHHAVRSVRRRGVVIAVGFYQGEGAGLALGEEFHHNAVQIRSGQIGNIHPAWSMERLRQRTIDLALAGELVLGGLPRLQLPVDRVADGFAALLGRPGEVLQVQLTYDGASAARA